MNAVWVIGAALSLASHGAFALWLWQRDVEPRVVTKKVVRFHVVAAAPKPPEPPKPIEPPPVEPPPTPPKLVKRARPRVETPPPPPDGPTKTDIVEPAESGLTPDASAPQGGMQVAQGGGIAGAIQDGQGASREKAPPAPPPQPAPRPSAKSFVPIFEVTRMPRALAQVQPEVPEEFRSSQREAVVVVEVAISASGKVLDARVIKKAGYGLDEAAMSAARRTRFEPALVGDKPVAVKMQIPYRFKVRG